MKLIDRETGTIVTEILTNHSMIIDDALDLAGFTVAEDGQIMDGKKGLYADYENLEMCWEAIGHWNKRSWGTETPPENVYDLMNKANDLIDVFHVQHGFDSDLTREYSNDLWEQYCRTGKVKGISIVAKAGLEKALAEWKGSEQPQKAKPSVQERLKDAASAKADAPKASSPRKEAPSL